MFETPFDRYNDAATAERREQEALEPTGDHDGAGDQPDAPKTLRRSVLWTGALIILSLVAAWWLFAGGTPSPAALPLPVVTIAEPLQREITEWDEFVGRFEASRSVEIRPQVSGQITRIHFTDGQYVRQGAPLFTIDARSYGAMLAEAKAEAARAESALALSRDNLARAGRLVAEDAIAATEIDRLKAEVRNNEASLAAARARVSSRSLDMSFTTVRAPISGRISDRRIDAGNLVSGGGGAEATLLTTINAVDPVYFEFAGSEALFLKARREGLDKGTPIEIRLQDETEYTWQGTLDFTDNALDSASGTIRARAVVTNGEGFLAPGLFGRMRLATGGTHQALLVPDTAVTTDQTRKLLLVVQKDGTVATRTVELGPLIGNLRVVERGLKPSDKVVIEGVQMAMPGQKVTAKQGRITAASPDVVSTAAAPRVSRAASATLAK
ncbi:efflux RND transporter periplasmic adaptor subunit [Allopontixanthobacter sediminis]|uniref:Efflux RND transporter periplasmic adaptor subunit n=1 Tax=Allopontixanthobacter sediminis TaxID=1689985 RepID=A0A845B8A8_9SPHN|nr:efflux RND transporter periplasmic adaptor subunit [Allopontixanthobacter sediminis]MXP45692.1 efflux RND transporter periplasmic adaptor subunit [Allopontixanthobacter sediminis]